MYGITISKNYSSELSECIDHNHTFFKKWFIVTQRNDHDTISVIEKKKLNNIHLIYYPLVPDDVTCDNENPFSDEDDLEIAYPPNLFADKSDCEIEEIKKTAKIKFDKGGAIRYVQKYVLPKYCKLRDLILIIDSDIILSKDLYELISKKTYSSETIYGAVRNDFLFKSDLVNNKNFKKYSSKNLAGYFQLYKYDNSKLYKRSLDCSYIDYEFLNNFDECEILSDIHVKHLGLPKVNWEGKLCDTFIDDTSKKNIEKVCKLLKVDASNKDSKSLKEHIRKRITSIQIENSNTKYKFPNVIIPGFRKCGSFSLKNTLSSHANIMFAHNFLSELNYCTNEKYFLSNWHNSHMWYLSHFQRDGTIWCDHSHDLLNKGCKISIDRMRTTYVKKKFKYADDVKFIVVIRNPIERAFAEYNHCMAEFPASYNWGWELPGKSFEDNVKAELDLIKNNNDFIWDENIKGRLLINGIYEPILKRLIQELDLNSGKLLVVPLDDLINNSDDTLNCILNFIEAEPQQLKITKLNSYSSKDKIDKTTYNLLYDFYKEFNLSLDELLKKKLCGNIYNWR